MAELATENLCAWSKALPVAGEAKAAAGVLINVTADQFLRALRLNLIVAGLEGALRASAAVAGIASAAVGEAAVIIAFLTRPGHGLLLMTAQQMKRGIAIATQSRIRCW